MSGAASLTRGGLEAAARAAADLVPETEGDTWFSAEHLTKDGRFAPEDASYIAVANPATVLALVAEIKALREGLEWYGEQALLARLIHSEGDAGRHALANDGGKRARALLTPEQPAVLSAMEKNDV